MKLYRFPEKKIWKACFCVYMFAMLLLCRDGLYTGLVIGFHKAQLLMIGVMTVGVLAFVIVRCKDLKHILTDGRMIIVIISALFLLLPMVIKRDWQLMYFSILLCLLFSVFLSYFVSMKETAKVYVVILCALSVYSIFVTYFFRLLPDNGILSMPVLVNDNGIEFYSFLFGFVPVTYVKGRNFGIFREPGVYQFFIMVALYLTNYVVDWKNKKSVWIVNTLLAATMLSTMATGGVIELGLFIVVWFFDKKLYKDKKIRMVAIGAVIVGLIVLVVSAIQKNAIYWFVYNTIFEKFVNRTASVTERTEAIQVNITLFLKNPVFGNRIADVLHAVKNNTSSTTILYAIVGVLGGSLNVAAWIALVWKKERFLIWNLALLLILFMSFNTQNLVPDVFFWLFPMMALTERMVPLLKKK